MVLILAGGYEIRVIRPDSSPQLREMVVFY